MALLVFLPARVLWQRVEQQKEATAPDKLTYFALAAGSLAALATAPCAPAHQVTRLASDGGTLYAGIGTSSRIEDIGIILASTQGWEDWHVVMYRQYNEWRTDTQYETIAKNPFNELRQLPITVCEPSEPTTCYRIDGTARVEISEDGGKNWATAWQADPGREDFRRRLAGGVLTGCGKIPNLQTFDLLVIPTQAGSTVLVAMGNEGLLVHPTGDGWQTVGVYTNPNDTWGIRIVPTPFAVRSLDEAINITAGRTAACPYGWIASLVNH